MRTDSTGGPATADLHANRMPDHDPDPTRRFPPGGPETVEPRTDGVALGYRPARLAREVAGLERLHDHLAAPTLLRVAEDALVVAPFGPAADPAPVLRAVRDAAGRHTFSSSRRALVDALSHEIGLCRALGRVGLPRRVVDRWLDARIAGESPLGTSLGGIHPGFFRVMGDRVVALRCERARRDAHLLHDWAALSMDGRDPDALRSGLAPTERAAFEVAMVAVWTREHVLGDRRAAALLEALVVDEPEPDETTISLVGPSFLRLECFGHQPGEQVSAARARVLLRALDGAIIGGEPVRLITEPAIRRGKAPPYRESRGVRRRRLFSRWFEGIQTDEEGLVGLTPEALADEIARDARGVVIDGTAGVGGLSIAHAQNPAVSRVIAVDRDANRLAMLMHNAAIYGVAERIEPVAADLLDVLPTHRADRLVVDPPWGGRDYDRQRVAIDDLPFPLRAVMDRFDGELVLKLPRSFDVRALGEGFSVRAAIDARSVLKFLVASRARKT